jgi:ribosomal protein L37E
MVLNNLKRYPNPNSNGKELIDCQGCGQRRPHHAKGYCSSCYKKNVYNKQLHKCKNCGRMRPHKAFGLCAGCHMRLHHYNKVKQYNVKKEHNITLELYTEITQKCACCGFDKLITLHHLDGNKKNNNPKNLIGLCPNCHKMIHSYQYYEEIKEKLASKGYDVAKIHPANYANLRP